MKQINKCIVHCSATKRSQDVNAATIRSWHMSKTPPWSDIGYHFVILKGGKIEAGRHLERMGAHVRGHNSDSIGICLEGGISEKGKPENNFDEGQFNSLRSLIDGMKFKYGFTEVKGHRDYSPDKNKDGVITKDEWLKECPCFDVGEWYAGSEDRKQEVETQKNDGVVSILDNVSDSPADNKKDSKSRKSRSSSSKRIS